MLLGSTLLEVGIGVVFVYLLLSLLCSAFNELIESFAKYRARDLETGIRRLLSDPGLAEAFFNHPLVKPLGEKPSYIPARTFSLALWNLATAGAEKGEKLAAGITRDLTAIKDVIAGLNDAQFGNIKVSLLTLIDEAGNDLGQARTNIEQWYDDAMERVSGWYKRRTHKRLIVMGFIAAALLNVDTLNVAQALWYNDTLRNSVTVAANDYLKVSVAASSLKPDPAPGSTATASSAENPLAAITNVRRELDSLGLPIGWISKPAAADQTAMAAYNADPRRRPDSAGGWFLKLLGIFLTALAVSQGAPFWFDVLNKFIVIRSTVKPREKSSEQPSKDKPAPETTQEKTAKDHQEQKD